MIYTVGSVIVAVLYGIWAAFRIRLAVELWRDTRDWLKSISPITSEMQIKAELRSASWALVGHIACVVILAALVVLWLTKAFG